MPVRSENKLKRNAILLQEAYRRDGHADFIKPASEVCGAPRSTLKKWRPKYRNGIYTEVSNDDIALYFHHGTYL